MIFDPAHCTLGEGPMWHPVRQQLFWFDILGQKLFCRGDGGAQSWDMGEYASAAGWVDRDTLLVATQTALLRFDLITGTGTKLLALEGDNPVTRSNDGRADAQGGFWIGTMGINAEPGAGAIYRFYRGALTRVWDSITIPNAICFAPGGRLMYFADTPTRTIWAQKLDAEGWPDGPRRVFVDLNDPSAEGPDTDADAFAGFNPDGAVVDAAGNLWNAQWGAGRVAAYSPAGKRVRSVDFPASQTSCPAFGGADGQQMFCTTARDGLAAPTQNDGATFALPGIAQGQTEHQVIL
ncbi:SMP-30/gluconolactonase/LRE family protein [Roseicitreum antarcticum]|uniref:Sugar lactone lactonase YvrE n=1 Tax=Roseicitreum antarcticum TaxID=564137 RepID=A0A1H2ZA10_9RHOB|nr:SMP-30/gluconolactonase/LRE family protein [Roseicitreum antarcticum]SDX13629.1 Sugar lactone lactonase YvrE [Roseicitreum antarcticum]